MKTSKLFLLLFLFLTSYLFSQSNIDLMPIPSEIKLFDGKFRIEKYFDLGIKGNPDKRIFSYATNFLRRLSGRTGLFFPQDFITSTTNADSHDVMISCQRPGNIVLNEDESYSLKIDSSTILIESQNELGAMKAMETLLQLLKADEEGYYFPITVIKDKPRFSWRGLMIDAARHFIPIDVIKRNLDAMAALKLNVMHWHLSEDQGFRVESKLFPKLHELGSDGYYYTQDQIKDIIKYAADRGIRIIPEFDVPGHSTAWFVGYPELASAPGPYKIERNWGVLNPTFNPTIEETYEFFDKFFGEMAALFPDPYFHIGGDENNGKQWDANKDIQEFMKKNNIKDNHELQAYFNNRILKILTEHGKIMVGWDEIQHPEMPTNIIIQSWRGQKGLVEAAKNGYSVILSNGYYIDLIQSAEFHYLNDPVPTDSPLSEEEKKKVLGGEATMWSELVTWETVDSRIWPRTAVIAERFWSETNPKDVDDMYRRLEIISPQLEELGLTHIKNYEMMLRRLSFHNDITPLKNLVDLLEPVKIYARHFQGVKYTSYSPYTRVVDAARPESMQARQFLKLVDLYLKERAKRHYNMIVSSLDLWNYNHRDMKNLIRLSPVLKEIEQHSINLSLLAEAGLKAVELIKNSEKADEEFKSKIETIILEAKKPYGQTELAVVNAIEKLLKACF